MKNMMKNFPQSKNNFALSQRRSIIPQRFTIAYKRTYLGRLIKSNVISQQKRAVVADGFNWSPVGKHALFRDGRQPRRSHVKTFKMRKLRSGTPGYRAFQTLPRLFLRPRAPADWKPLPRRIPSMGLLLLASTMPMKLRDYSLSWCFNVHHRRGDRRIKS